MLPGATRPIREGNPWDPVVTEAWPAAEKKDGTGELATASKLRLTNDHDWWRKAPRSKNVTFPPGCPALSNYSMSSMHTFYHISRAGNKHSRLPSLHHSRLHHSRTRMVGRLWDRRARQQRGFRLPSSSATLFTRAGRDCTCSAPMLGSLRCSLPFQELAVVCAVWWAGHRVP